MKIYTQRLENIASERNFESLELTFDTRQKSRFRATLKNGVDIGADLPRTSILRSGSFIATEQGDVLRVDAKAERLMQVSSQDPFELLKAAVGGFIAFKLSMTVSFKEP